MDRKPLGCTHRQLSQLLELLPQAVLVAQGGRVCGANRAAEALLGPAVRRVDAVHVADLFHPEDQDRIGERWRLVEGGRAQDFYERMRVRAVSGRWVAVDVALNGAAWGGRAAAMLLLVRAGRTEAGTRASAHSGADDEPQARAENDGLSRRLLEQQERERAGVARELHDEIGQCLSAVRVQFSLLQRRPGAAELKPLLDSAAAMTERALGRVRALSLLLHPPQLDTLGLEAALRWHVGEQQRAHPATQISLATSALPAPDDSGLAIAAFRIVQEALENALRHADPPEVRIAVEDDGVRLHIHVADSGRGFDPGSPEVARHHGLAAIRERARRLGGDVRFWSSPGAGTTVAATLPRP